MQPEQDSSDAGLAGLLGPARAGDADAWEAIYRRAYARLFSYARRRLPSDSAADDAVSETMARAMDGMDRFVSATPGTAGFDGWLARILRNVVFETYRHNGRLQAGAAPADEISVEPEPGERLLVLEQHAALRRAFALLDPSDREVLELRVVGRLTADEAGQVLDKQAGAVRMAQSRALQRLRTALEEVGGAD